MPKYQAITKTDFANLRWKRYESYHFAALDAVAPLVVQELPNNNRGQTTVYLGFDPCPSASEQLRHP